MKPALIFFFLLWITTSLTIAHPVHVSVCNIEFEDQKMLISMKIFQDDFLIALEHNFGKVIDLPVKDESENSKMINNYLTSSFQIFMNKKDTLRLNYLRSEQNEEAVWFYFESQISELKKITIDNTILLDIYDDQTNLVIVNNNGKQNGYRFNGKNYSQVIDLRK